MKKYDLRDISDLGSFQADIESRIENGFVDGAINRTKSQLIKYPDVGQLHYLLAKAYIEKGDYPTAGKYIQLGESLNQENIGFHYLRAQLSLEEGDLEGAREVLALIRGLDPGDQLVERLAIDLALAEEDYIGLAQLLENTPGDKYIGERLEAYYRTGDLEACQKLANKVRLRSPNSQEGILASEYLLRLKDRKISSDKAQSDLDEALEELRKLIGLNNVKREIEKIVGSIEFQKIREAKGIIDESTQSYHLGFYGNPGTGKTTVAQLLGRIFKELGILEKGHLVEVGRPELVAGYIGQTAIQTKEKIEEAYGGILFIDEAYSLARGGDQDFGGEAIDTLIKEMEDKRDKFIVIMAGYTNEMQDLMAMNPGLKSRINLEIEFEDYNQEELLEIGKMIAGKSKFNLSETGEIGFLEKIEEERTSPYFANGRACRNIIEAAIRERGQRIGRRVASMEDLTTLDAIDFGVDLSQNLEEELEEHLRELNSLIGLDNVKRELEKIKTQVMVNKAREEEGLVAEGQSYHMIFTGNPGTGKTTVARYLGKIFKALGILSTGHLVEVDRGDLVGAHIGSTAPKTKKVIQSAYGGILFIDEAYSLAQGGEQDFGREAIDTLLKEMEDKRDKFILVMAGYTNEMRSLISMNPGLKSRINMEIDFPDYREEELLEIGRMIAKGRDYQLTADGEEAFLRKIKEEKSQENFSNARACRNLIEDAIKEHSYRIVGRPVSREEMSQLRAIDFGITDQVGFQEDLDRQMDRLKGLIGLEEVKDLVGKIKNQVILNQRRLNAGLEVAPSSYHMIFTGNPGTGKTTVARIVGDIFKSLGVLSKGHLVEVDRADLVAGYVGQTAEKTLELVKSAYGGVLFVDEAYSLARGDGANDFGGEALDTLIKQMEDHRDKLVVIFAGYTKEMEDLLAMNPGLKSRVGNIIEFADYNEEEMFQIFKIFLEQEQYYLDEKAQAYMKEYLAHITRNKDRDFGNGRTARNIFEDLKKIQAERVVEDLEADILEIRIEDVERLK